ncbi:MAG: hypothetical protein Q9181_001193 [Wetmoreana brouardii]
MRLRSTRYIRSPTPPPPRHRRGGFASSTTPRIEAQRAVRRQREAEQRAAEADARREAEKKAREDAAEEKKKKEKEKAAKGKKAAAEKTKAGPKKVQKPGPARGERGGTRGRGGRSGRGQGRGGRGSRGGRGGRGRGGRGPARGRAATRGKGGRGRRAGAGAPGGGDDSSSSGLSSPRSVSTPSSLETYTQPSSPPSSSSSSSSALTLQEPTSPESLLSVHTPPPGQGRRYNLRRQRSPRAPSWSPLTPQPPRRPNFGPIQRIPPFRRANEQLPPTHVEITSTRSSRASRSLLSPRPAGVKKWGRYSLPPLGEPYWREKNGAPTLFVPAIVDDAGPSGGGGNGGDGGPEDGGDEEDPIPPDTNRSESQPEQSLNEPDEPLFPSNGLSGSYRSSGDEENDNPDVPETEEQQQPEQQPEAPQDGVETHPGTAGPVEQPTKKGGKLVNLKLPKGAADQIKIGRTQPRGNPNVPDDEEDSYDEAAAEKDRQVQKRKRVAGDEKGSSDETDGDNGETPRKRSKTPDRAIQGYNLMGALRRIWDLRASDDGASSPREPATNEGTTSGIAEYLPAQTAEGAPTPGPSSSGSSKSSDTSSNGDKKNEDDVIRNKGLNDLPLPRRSPTAPDSPDSLHGWDPALLPSPEPWDVPEGTRTRGHDWSPSHHGNWGLDNAEFIQSDHGYEEGWVGVKPLGQGGGGRAGLWEKRDKSGNIIDRVCIKQIKHAKRAGMDYKPAKPDEVEVMENLRQWPKSGILQLRGYRRYPRSKAHRLYLDYCEHGDLGGLITKYRIEKQYFPEEFIWEVFYHMARACASMARGPTPRDRKSTKTTYVHRDIKPGNIFLGAPESYEDDGIPIYPTPVLGDFGTTVATGPRDTDNPWLWKGPGTSGYKAPVRVDHGKVFRSSSRLLLLLQEQKMPREYQDKLTGAQEANRDRWVEQEVRPHFPKMGPQTNVWGVGACIYKLMLLTNADFDFYGKVKHGEVMDKVKTHRQPKDYSQELRDLVHDCLKFDPDWRPSPTMLLRRIESERKKFRDRWQAGEAIEEPTRLLVTNDELNQMETGPWTVTHKTATTGLAKLHSNLSAVELITRGDPAREVTAQQTCRAARVCQRETTLFERIFSAERSNDGKDKGRRHSTFNSQGD